MNDRISYEYESLNLEFSPNGRLADGDLTVVSGDDAFVATVSILKVPARDKYVSAAVELYPDSFDEKTLKLALNDLAIQIKELQLEAAAKAEEAAGSQDGYPEALVDEEDIDSLIGVPGVLDRYVAAMADVHEVYGDRPHMKEVMLGAISAQLDPPRGGEACRYERYPDRRGGPGQELHSGRGGLWVTELVRLRVRIRVRKEFLLRS